MADVAGLGPISAGTKSTVSRKRWKRLVQTAHKRGYTVESFLDQTVPTALKERTRKSIETEARRTVKSAYDPALQETAGQQRRVNAIAQTRKAALDDYQTWVQTQHAKARVAQVEADTALRDAGRDALTGVSTSYEQAKETAKQTLAQTPGTVASPANLDMGRIDAAKQRDTSKVMAASAGNEGLIGVNDTELARTQSNTMAFLASLEAKRASDQRSDSDSINQQRNKLLLQRASDAQQEISRLLGVEITKANANRDAAFTAEAYDIKRGAQELAKQKFDLDAEKFDFSRQLQLRLAAQTDRRLDIQEADNAARLDLGWYNARHKGKGSGKGGKGDGKDPQSQFELAYATVATTPRKTGSDGTKYFYTDQNGLALLKRGSKVDKDGKARDHRSQMISALVAQLKVSPEIARRAVDAFIGMGGTGSDPGTFRKWRKGQAGGDPKPTVKSGSRVGG